MIAYHDIKIWAQVLLLTAQLIALCVGICQLPDVYRHHSITPKILVPVGTFLSGAMLVIYSSEIRSVKRGSALPAITDYLSQKPAILPIMTICLIIAYFVFVFIRQYNDRSSRITRASIKEGVDKLPAGLCFYYENGRCVLTNHQMNKLCYEIVGTDLQNAANFWAVLSGGKTSCAVCRLPSKENPTFRLADGTVWTFVREKLDGLYQLSAVEVTQVQKTTEQLELKKQDLDRVNRRLKKYGENVDELTRTRERLETKANIHRMLGRALLVTRKFVCAGHDQDAPFDMWETIVAMLRSENIAVEEDSLAMFLRSAKQAGIGVETVGEFPVNTDVKNLFVKAAVESLVNAVRHAEASTLYISLGSENDSYTVRFTNNGKKPQGEIVEGGGLGSLRRKVTSLGGKMTVETVPAFALNISIPCKRGEDECTE